MTFSPRHICTIVAKNYLAFARTLCDSFLAHHPDGKCHVLVIDGYEGYIDPARERFEIVPLPALPIPNLREFCFKYDITELSTAVKPYLLQHLFETRGMDRIFYLDPDILVLAPLSDLFAALDGNDAILTPHLDADYPDDGLFPNDAHVMKSGVFNLGFIGVRNTPAAAEMLRWWQGKLYDKCVIDHAAGYFVDQKFMDLAVTLFPGIAIVRDPGYNVAYWNLHSRRVAETGGRWTVNGNPLFFYHFSNYKPERPDEISGFQTRYALRDLPDLSRLFARYRELLRENGYETSFRWPYSHGRYADGRPIPRGIRKLYRQFGRPMGIADPFDRVSHPALLRALELLARGKDACFRRAYNLVIRVRPLRELATRIYGPFPARPK